MNAILLLETGGEDKDRETELIRKYCGKNGCTFLQVESDPERVELLWKVRRNVSKAVKEIAAYRVSEDLVVPNSHFPELVAFVADLNRESSLRINSWGHAGDGNLHVNFMASSRSPEELALIEAGIERVMRKVLDLGGTLTGEHGIGLAKKKYLRWEIDEPTLRAMAAIKAVFDPDNLLNPGKMFPDEIFDQ